MYDESGRPIAFALSENGGANEYYFYESNIFGDITAIYDEDGNVVASYKYDAWGNFTAATSKNYFFTDASLFKYRGYIYDWDTGFYYLQSRYYDPEVGRFINADDVDYLGANGDLTSYNLFAYCSNNPVMYVDPEGEFSWKTLFWVGLAVVVIGVAVVVAAPVLVTGAAVAVSSVAAVGIDIAIVGITVSGISIVGDMVENEVIFSKDSGYDPDPYKRPGQKKQGRENKNKNRQNPNYTPRNNRRNNKPAKPKSHTPGREHQKYKQNGYINSFIFYNTN